MIDDTNKQLLLNLRKNGRAKLSDMHRSTRIPITTIFERMKAFSSYVKKYATILDWQKLGFGIRVVITVKIKKRYKERLQKFLLEHKNVNCLNRVNNNYDFILEAIFISIKELEEFNEEIRSLKASKTKMFFIVETVREEFLFTEKKHLQLLKD